MQGRDRHLLDTYCVPHLKGSAQMIFFKLREVCSDPHPFPRSLPLCHDTFLAHLSILIVCLSVAPQPDSQPLTEYSAQADGRSGRWKITMVLTEPSKQ